MNEDLAPALAGLYDANDHAQFGLSVREGATAMWRVIRASCSALKRNAVPDQVLLKLDLANAFNSVNRSYIFSTIQQHAPAILPWIQSSYGTSIPHFSDAGTEFSSQVGVRQGDPLSPALFSLVFYNNIRADMPGPTESTRVPGRRSCARHTGRGQLYHTNTELYKRLDRVNTIHFSKKKNTTF